MKVKDLIQKLSELNPDATVLVYCYEDLDKAKFVKTKQENQEGNTLYCKGFSFKEYEREDPTDYVVIGRH